MSNTNRKGVRLPGIYSTMHTHYPLCPVNSTEHEVTSFRTDVRIKEVHTMTDKEKLIKSITELLNKGTAEQLRIVWIMVRGTIK